MYQRDLTIQKGLKNRVQIQFKNSDQKRVNVSTGTFIFSMFDQIEQRQLLQKTLTVLDQGTTSTRGLGLLELTESDTLDLDTGFYKFSVASVEADGSRVPTYANTYYGVGGTLELKQDSFPVLTPSTEVKNFQAQWNADTQLHEYYSGNLRADPEFNGVNALHTMAFYMTRFKGDVIVEGTQENTPGNFGSYAQLSRTTYTGTTGIQYVNFYGVWSYVRVRYIPVANPFNNVNNDTENAYHGTLDKLLYRS